MSDTAASGWQNPKELSTQDQIYDWISKASPRDGSILCAAIMLTHIQFNPKAQKQDQHTYVELVRNMLNGIKHTAEMDLMGFLLEQVIEMQKEHGEQLPVDELLYMLTRGAEMAKKASLKCLAVAHNLAGLYEEPGK